MNPLNRIAVLVIEQEKSRREALCRFVRAWNFEPVVAQHGAAAVEAIARHACGIALVCHDSRPGALEFLRELRQPNPKLETILMTDQCSPEMAAEAFHAGAYDCLGQPLNFRQLGRDLNTLRDSLRQRDERMTWSAELGEEPNLAGMIGDSAPMRAMFAGIRRLAAGKEPVLITGHTGTGKELAARALHSLASSTGPLLVYRCCGSKGLAERDLFGSGTARTPQRQDGTPQRKTDGILNDRGATILLDEIGELPAQAQRKLEEFLMTQSANSTSLCAGPARILATSGPNLYATTPDRKFSLKLYDLFSENVIHIPSLSERMEDLPLLSRHFLKQANQEFGKEVVGFSPAAQSALLNYKWPGNVRELENVIARACLLADGDRIEVQDLSIAHAQNYPWAVNSVLDGASQDATRTELSAQ